MNILAEDIQNTAVNRTRFLVIGREMLLPPDADKISVCFSLPHCTGTLSGVLARFAAAGLNLTKSESRPIPGKNFEFDFYLDFTGNVRDEHTLNLLCTLHDELPRFSFLGNYRGPGDFLRPSKAGAIPKSDVIDKTWGGYDNRPMFFCY